MKTKLFKKRYGILLAMFYIMLVSFGWYLGRILFMGYLGSIVFSVIGFIVATAIDHYFPRWNYDLTWRDIDLALHNMYKYGLDPFRLWFRVGNRRIQIYRDEKGNKKNPVRMEVSIPSGEWADLLKPEDFTEVGRKYCCEVISSEWGKEEFYFFVIKDSQESPEMCMDILKYLFTISIGGLSPDIMAESYNFIWREQSQKDAEKLLSRKRFFDGKKGKNKAAGKTEKKK